MCKMERFATVSTERTWPSYIANVTFTQFLGVNATNLVTFEHVMM
jgi:hypothetical protein